MNAGRYILTQVLDWVDRKTLRRLTELETSGKSLKKSFP